MSDREDEPRPERFRGTARDEPRSRDGTPHESEESTVRARRESVESP